LGRAAGPCPHRRQAQRWFNLGLNWCLASTRRNASNASSEPSITIPNARCGIGARLSAPGPSTISPGVSTGTRPPAMHHYAKAIAYAALKNFREAEKQRRLFQYIEPWAWMHPPAARAGGPADPAKQGGRSGPLGLLRLLRGDLATVPHCPDGPASETIHTCCPCASAAMSTWPCPYCRVFGHRSLNQS